MSQRFLGEWINHRNKYQVDLPECPQEREDGQKEEEEEEAVCAYPVPETGRVQEELGVGGRSGGWSPDPPHPPGKNRHCLPIQGQ